MEEVTISKIQRHFNLSFVKAKKLYDCYQSELTEQKRGQVEAEVIKIFAVDELEFDFDENKQGNREKLEKYFEEEIKEFVLKKIIEYKMNIGDLLIFSEEKQESGVWQIKITQRKYFLDMSEKMVDQRFLELEVLLDDWYFD